MAGMNANGNCSCSVGICMDLQPFVERFSQSLAGNKMVNFRQEEDKTKILFFGTVSIKNSTR